MKMVILHFLFLFSSLLLLTHGFNIDVQHTYMEFSNNIAGSQFGFAVTIQKADTLLVGAPLTNTTGNNEGALFQCTITKNGQCSQLDIPDTLPTSNKREHQRKDQRMGMSVARSGENVLSCAPRWHQDELYQGEQKYWYRGRCSSLKSDLSVDYQNNPCQYEYTGNSFFGYCTAGLSSTATSFNNAPLYVVGAPGALNFKGVLIAIYKDRNFRGNTDRITDINSLMGYSVAFGNFTNFGVADVAGGAPRATDLRGKVIVYNIPSSSQFDIKANIENPDDQIGTYFGAAVCAADVDGDGKDDLLVGAPMYSKTQDEGRVYVYMNAKGPTYSGFDLQTDRLNGESQIRAKFGSTIVNVGDLNDDGFHDVIIGAPFGGPDGSGAVYVYNGGSSGLGTQYSQVIYASNLGSPSGFGSAISSGFDVDGNGYPDFAIGAYLGSKAFLFKSKSVITLRDRLSTNITSIPAEKENSNCVGPDGAAYHCTSFEFNLEYSGKGSPATFDVEVTLELDLNKLSGIKRAYVLPDGSSSLKNSITKNVTLTKNTVSKIPLLLYFELKLDNDVESPIIKVAHYKAYENSNGCGNGPCPVLDSFGTTTSRMEVSYLKRCGTDSTCDTDLVVKSKISLPQNPEETDVVYGVVYEVNVEISVINKFEPAYQAYMKLNFSSDLQVIGVDINKKQYILWKQLDLNPTTKQLIFPVANPLQNMMEVDIVAKFSVTKPRPSNTTYSFTMEASSNGKELKPEDNKAANSIGTKIQTCIRVQGDARPSQIIYNPKQGLNTVPEVNASVTDVGQEVNYTFYVQNAGKTPVDTLLAEVEIVVKKESLDLVYVVDMMVDDVMCIGNDLNPLNYTVLHQQSDQSDEPRSRKRRETTNTKVNCRSGNCKTYSCNINRIQPGEGSPIYIITRLWRNSLVKLDMKPSDIETEVNIVFNGQDRDQYVQKDNKCNTQQMVKVTVRSSEEESGSGSIAWWIILLAVLGAIIFLAIACAILYKVGFFKRNRKIKEITGPTGNEAENPNKNPDGDFDDDDDDDEE